SFFRVDEQVFFTMAVLSIVSLLVLAFRFSTRETCGDVKITIAGGSLTEGRVVHFKAETLNGKAFRWDFGDGGSATTQTVSTNHVYKVPGKYTVSVSVSGGCSDVFSVYVNPAPVLKSTAIQPAFVYTEPVYVNEEVTFGDNTPGSVSREWRFGETNR